MTIYTFNKGELHGRLRGEAKLGSGPALPGLLLAGQTTGLQIIVFKYVSQFRNSDSKSRSQVSKLNFALALAFPCLL